MPLKMKTPRPPFARPDVRAAFDAFDTPARDGLLQIRALIFETAAADPAVGQLEETLKWGQPAYLTPETRSGSTIRLGVPKEGGFALYAHCQTTIISDFQGIFPDAFRYEGNRAVHFQADTALALDSLRLLVASALTYHLQKKR